MSCDGRCCAAFYLPYTWDEIQARQGTLADGGLLADMIVPLSPERTRNRRALFGIEESPIHAEGHYFTCRHWDARTGLCGIYDERPSMCRDYPYETECGYCGHVETPDVIARWKAVRAREKRLYTRHTLGVRELERDRRRYPSSNQGRG